MKFSIKSHRIAVMTAASSLGVLLACGVPVAAQVNTASITGTVTDTSGAIIPNATVTATSIATGATSSEKTGATGRYTIVNLTPGYYDVRVTAQGFATAVRSNQEFLVGTTVTINFQMQVGTVAQTVTVTQAAPIIETTQTNVDTVVESSQVNDLPIFNRGYSTLAQLAPGVLINSASTGVTEGDSPTGGMAYVVDNAQFNGENGGGLEMNVVQDWIQEFSVVTSLAPAEYTFATEGYINAVTRSGSNQIHGRGYGYFQNSALNAAPGFLPAKAPTKPPYHQNRLGGFVGGPIKKDKLFYFLGLEHLGNLTSQAVDLPAAFTSTVPNVESGVFPVTQSSQYGFAKMDYQITPKSALHLEGVIEVDDETNQSLTTTTSVSAATPVHESATDYQLTWDYILSPTIFNELNGQTIGQSVDTGCNSADELGPYKGVSQFGVPAPDPSQETAEGDPLGYSARITYTAAQVTVACAGNAYGWKIERHFIFGDTLSLVKGNHSFKFGAIGGHRNFGNRSQDFYGEGNYTINSGLTPFNPATAGPGTSCTSCYPTAVLFDHNPPPDSITDNDPDPFFGAFAQDSWKATSNLTLNLGMRYDMDWGFQDTENVNVLAGLNHDGVDYHEIQPRAGFAWTPFHDGGRTVLRGGFGVYYQQNFVSFQGTYLLSDVYPEILNGEPQVFTFTYNVASANPYCIVPASAGGVSCSSGVPTAAENAVQEVLAYALATDTVINFNPTNLTAPGNFTLQMPLGGPSYTVPAITGPIPVKVYDGPQTYRMPGSYQITFGGEHQIGTGMGVSADFNYVYGFSQPLFNNSNVTVNNTTINPAYSIVEQWQSDGISKGYSLDAALHDRDQRGDFFQLAYTLGFAYNDFPDIGSNSTTFSIGPTSAGSLQTDPFDPMRDWGPSGAVPRSIINGSGMYKFPWGILLAPMVQYNTGLRYTPTVGTARSGTYVSPCPVTYYTCYPAAPYATKSSFVGNSLFTVDGRLSKKFTFHERYSTTLMFEGFNLNNRSNYTSHNLVYSSNGSTLSSTFGVPTAMGPRRQLQGGFEFDF